MKANLKTVDKRRVQDVHVTQRKLKYEFKPLVDNLKNQSKPLDLVWDSVRFGKIKRLYYYCKKNRIWNNAHRVNEGFNHNYYVKFGIHTRTHDSKIIHELQSMIGEVGNNKSILSEHGDPLILSPHFHETFFSYWEAVGTSHSRHDTLDLGQAFSFSNHDMVDLLSHHHLDSQSHSFSHSDSFSYSHHSPHHSDHSHSSDSSTHFSWFFQSFWNMAGMNPYAVCVSKNKAHDPKVEKGLKGKFDAVSDKHKNPSAKYNHPHPSKYPSDFERVYSKSALLNHISHLPAGKEPVQGDSTHSRSSSSHIQVTKSIVGLEHGSISQKPGNVKSEILTAKSGPSKIETSILETGTRQPETIIPQLYISPRIPKKIVSQIVIGAEALPE